MKEKAVIFECSADAIIDIRKRLDEIASVTNGSIWFETIGQNTINGYGPSLTKYSIICHYPEAHMEIIDKYYESKVRNIQNTFESELDSARNKLTKYTHIIQALTGRPIDEIIKSWDICDNGFGVNYRFNPNGHSTIDISMSRTKREVLLEKENEELKKRLKSAERSDYVTPLRDRVDICEEKINEVIDRANEHEEDLDTLEADLDDCKKDISEQDRRLDCHHNRLMSLSERVNTLSKQYNEFNEDIKELKDKLDKHIENCKTINNMHQHSIGIVDSMKTLDIIDINNRLSDLGSELDDYINDYKEAYKHLDNSDEALDRRIKALERSRECDWYALQQARKDITDLVNSVCDDNRTINNTLTDLNIRLKTIEKRLSIKPFYAPTEDEKDDD